MLFTYHTKPLLDFVDRNADASNPEHVRIRACLASAVQCNAVYVQLGYQEHCAIVAMEIEQRPTHHPEKEPTNDNHKA